MVGSVGFGAADVGLTGGRPYPDLMEDVLGPPGGTSAVVLVEVRILRCAGLHSGEAADEIDREARVEQVVPEEVPVGRVAVVAFSVPLIEAPPPARLPRAPNSTSRHGRFGLSSAHHLAGVDCRARALARSDHVQHLKGLVTDAWSTCERDASRTSRYPRRGLQGAPTES